MKKTPKVMVCVTRQKSCERLIKGGAALAEQVRHSLVVVHALSPDQNVLGDAMESEALEWLYKITAEENGELTMLRTEDVEEALFAYATKNNVQAIVMGESPDAKDNIAARLKARMPYVKVIVVQA